MIINLWVYSALSTFYLPKGNISIWRKNASSGVVYYIHSPFFNILTPTNWNRRLPFLLYETRFHYSFFITKTSLCLNVHKCKQTSIALLFFCLKVLPCNQLHQHIYSYSIYSINGMAVLRVLDKGLHFFELPFIFFSLSSVSIQSHKHWCIPIVKTSRAY